MRVPLIGMYNGEDYNLGEVWALSKDGEINCVKADLAGDSGLAVLFRQFLNVISEAEKAKKLIAESKTEITYQTTFDALGGVINKTEQNLEKMMALSEEHRRFVQDKIDNINELTAEKFKIQRQIDEANRDILSGLKMGEPQEVPIVTAQVIGERLTIISGELVLLDNGNVMISVEFEKDSAIVTHLLAGLGLWNLGDKS